MRARSLLLLLFCSVLSAAPLAACERVGPPPNAPVELDTPMPDAGLTIAPLDGAARDPSESSRCTMVLVADNIQTPPSCELDERISHGAGLLSFSCSGDGFAEARFQDHVFEGNIVSNRLHLTLVSEIDWEDGCRWESRQSIEGDVRAMTLSWTYSERPVSGASCNGACRARAEIIIHRELTDTPAPRR